MSSLPRHIHVVWSKNTGPLHAYRNPLHADKHGHSMLGVEVTSVMIGDTLTNVTEVHVVWSPDAGPLVGFADPIAAHRFAKEETSITGVQVGSCELLYDLPDAVAEDYEVDEYESDEVTPIEIREGDEVPPHRKK